GARRSRALGRCLGGGVARALGTGARRLAIRVLLVVGVFAIRVLLVVGVFVFRVLLVVGVFVFRVLLVVGVFVFRVLLVVGLLAVVFDLTLARGSVVGGGLVVIAPKQLS